MVSRVACNVSWWRHKGQWCGAVRFSLICAWTNGWTNHRHVGHLRRHRAHYVVTVMCSGSEVCMKFVTADLISICPRPVPIIQMGLRLITPGHRYHGRYTCTRPICNHRKSTGTNWSEYILIGWRHKIFTMHTISIQLWTNTPNMYLLILRHCQILWDIPGFPECIWIYLPRYTLQKKHISMVICYFRIHVLFLGLYVSTKINHGGKTRFCFEISYDEKHNWYLITWG